jgi:hypothetical protein
MNTRSHTIFAAALLALSAAAFTPSIAAAQVGVTVVIGQAPPPLRYERVPPPRNGYIWSPGYWDWRSNRHVWIGGNWVAARPGYVYAQPHWVQRQGRWYREQARWNRGPNGDRDHDGVPNRYDHHDNRGHYRDDHRNDHRSDHRNDHRNDHRDDHRGRGDRDHDGVPDRHDRRPDNPRRD